jgi:hypothetical protein
LDYLLYGLSVRTDRPLPGLRALPRAAAAELRMHLGSFPPPLAAAALEPAPWHASERAAGPGDEPSLVIHRTAGRRGYRLRYADGIAFSVDAEGREVGCTWPDPLTLEDAATYLLGSICGFALRLRGVTSLHASAVAVGGAAAAFCGPAGAGKSTTAAALAARGHRVLADDVSALDRRGERFHLRPAYPHLRLWPDAARALYGDAPLPPLTPNWDKRYLDLALADDAFQATPLPLAAVYVLAGREEAHAPRLEPVPASEALLTLVANVYMGWLPGAAERARDFARMGELAAGVPVVRLVPHRDPARLPELCGLIERDVAARAESSLVSGGARG